MACSSSGESVWSADAALDALGVGAGLGAAVDGGDDEPVAGVVEQRDREREPPAHVAEGVEADDRDVAERVGDVGARLLEATGDAGELLAQGGDLGGLARDGLDERGGPAVGALENDVVALHPPEAEPRGERHEQRQDPQHRPGESEGVGHGLVKLHGRGSPAHHDRPERRMGRQPSDASVAFMDAALNERRRRAEVHGRPRRRQ